MTPKEVRDAVKQIRWNKKFENAARKRGDNKRADQYDAENRSLLERINEHRRKYAEAGIKNTARFT